MHPSMKRIFDDVAKFGWHIIAVAPREDEFFVEFAFTVGLFQTYQHPELILFGLSRNVAHRVLAKCVQCIEENLPFADGQVRSDVLNDYDTALLAVDQSFYAEYLGSAIGFYDTVEFPALQLVWPDRNHHFPWEPACDPTFIESQTILSLAT
jgi:hypothetical protein